MGGLHALVEPGLGSLLNKPFHGSSSTVDVSVFSPRVETFLGLKMVQGNICCGLVFASILRHIKSLFIQLWCHSKLETQASMENRFLSRIFLEARAFKKEVYKKINTFL